MCVQDAAGYGTGLEQGEAQQIGVNAPYGLPPDKSSALLRGAVWNEGPHFHLSFFEILIDE